MLRTDKIRRWRQIGLCTLLCLAVHGLAIAETKTSTSPTKPAQASATQAKKSKHRSGAHATTNRSRGKKGSKKRGQAAIDSTRARQIQTALIREHYMQGQPSGTWDAATQAAMHRYQADQGWQSKQIPDSRALIKLGLGPSHDHLLNPESAMTSAPGDPKAAAKPTPPENNLPH